MVRLNVVVSQGQGRNPQKRKLEEELIQQLTLQSGLDVILVPHLYDLKTDSTAMMALKNLSGHAVVLSWFFPRAAHWLLARNGVHGKQGTVLLTNESEDDESSEDDLPEEEMESVEAKFFPQADGPGKQRFLYHVDFRASNSPNDFLNEVVRIQNDLSSKLVSLSLGGLGTKKSPGAINGNGVSQLAPTNPAPSQQPAKQPVGFSLGMEGLVENRINGAEESSDQQDSNREDSNGSDSPLGSLKKLVEDGTKRRWYPVVDYSRCTNCMECIDFCLFGVYGVDQLESLVVEQPDNCRKGCPACSRVCPENAIIFPQHKSPAIAGSNDVGSGLKIDLSKLFGAPDGSVSAEETAARERDEHLMLNGRQPVGTAVGMKRFRGSEITEKNELDDLIDNLDALDI